MIEPDLLDAMFKGMAGGANDPSSRMAAHMPALYVLAREWSWGEVVELGVGAGWSTLALLAGARAAGQHLVSYDIDPAMRARAMHIMGFRGVDLNNVPVEGWEFRVRASVDAAGDFPDKSVSLWFLDTEHTYEATSAELRAWVPKMYRGGVMCGHDYLLHENPQWAVTAGVKRAVDEFVEKSKGRFSLQVLPHDCGLFILWPR